MSSKSDKKEDMTGQDRMLSNVLLSWAGHLVFIVAGFIMPRLIDNHLGQVTLGVWDFGWGIVNYLNLINFGIGPNLNRYVGKYRAKNELENLCRITSSVYFTQYVISTIFACAILIVFYNFDRFFAHSLGDNVDNAKWVVVFLGASLWSQLLFGGARGVLTGYHRWDIHNYIHSISYMCITAGMVILLVMGQGIVSLAIVYFVGSFIAEVSRAYMAKRIATEIVISYKHVNRGDIIKMFMFGGKVMLNAIPRLVTIQTTNIFVIQALGPAALAILSRPLALVRHVEMFISKYTFILAPAAGSMQGENKEVELRKLFIESHMYSNALTFPPIIILIVFGDYILNLWMGADYANGHLTAILAGGGLIYISQKPSMNILTGMNMHGKIGIILFTVTLGSYFVGLIYLEMTFWSLERAAIIFTVSNVLGYGVVLPWFACRRLHVSAIEYLKGTMLVPLACNLIFVVVLYLTRIYGMQHYILNMVFGSIVSLSVLSVLYWHFILPEKAKFSVRNKMFGKVKLLNENK